MFVVYLAALAFTLITGLSFIFGKVALAVAHPLDLLAFRFTASFLGILSLFFFKKVHFRYTLKQILKILPLALFYPLLFFTFQTFGLEAASAIEASILSASIPIFTLLMATFFLKERASLLQIISIIASVAGVIYITLMKGASLEIRSLKGIIFILLSTLSFAGYSVLARILTKEFSSLELTTIMVVISFLCFNILVVGKHLVSGTLHQFLLPLKDYKFVISVLYLGLLSTMGTSFLTNLVLSHLEASKMSVFSNLGTIITVIASVVFLKEELYYYHIIGSLLIIGGVLGTNFLDKKRAKRQNST